jgi:hypothetical protein
MNASLLESDSSQDDRPDPAQAEPPGPLYCVVGDTLCRVRVWTEDEWSRLEPAARPSPAVHVPGLGWVAAELSAGLDCP